MDDSIVIVFEGEGSAPNRVKYRVICGKDCDANKLAIAAQAMVYIAATESRNGFEKEIEIITTNAMNTRAQKIQ